MTQAYPLQWPIQRPRTAYRKRATFNKKKPTDRGYDETVPLTVADASERLQREVDLLGARDYVLSTNLQTRIDGRPRSGQAEPRDPGVALYFTLKGKPHCLPCDTFDRVADNIAAIAKHIEATRAIERYGVASIAEMFTGFAALPSPEMQRPWWEVLGVNQSASKDEIRSAYRRKSMELHQNGAGETAQVDLNIARDRGLEA